MARSGAPKAMRPRSTAPCLWTAAKRLRSGEIVRVRIDDADEYDLYGSLVDD